MAAKKIIFYKPGFLYLCELLSLNVDNSMSQHNMKISCNNMQISMLKPSGLRIPLCA